MQAIALEAGVTPAALYYYYDDKRELLFNTLEDIVKRLVETCRQPRAEVERDPAAALSNFVAAYITFQLRELKQVAPMYSSLVHGVKRQRNLLTHRQLRILRAFERQLLDSLRDIITAGNKSGEFDVQSPTITAFAIIGMCEHTINWVNPSGKVSVPSLASYYSQLAFRIVRKTAERQTLCAADGGSPKS
jgi:AcrR family transcriptional regulator